MQQRGVRCGWRLVRIRACRSQRRPSTPAKGKCASSVPRRRSAREPTRCSTIVSRSPCIPPGCLQLGDEAGGGSGASHVTYVNSRTHAVGQEILPLAEGIAAGTAVGKVTLSPGKLGDPCHASRHVASPFGLLFASAREDAPRGAARWSVGRPHASGEAMREDSALQSRLRSSVFLRWNSASSSTPDL